MSGEGKGTRVQDEPLELIHGMGVDGSEQDDARWKRDDYGFMETPTHLLFPKAEGWRLEERSSVKGVRVVLRRPGG